MRFMIAALLFLCMTCEAVKPPRGSLVDYSNPLSRSLVAYFPLWEGTGGTVYDIHNKLSGALYTGNPSNKWSPGKKGPSFYFTGVTNEYISLNDSPLYDVGGECSWSIWCYLTSTDNGQGLYSQNSGGGNAYTTIFPYFTTAGTSVYVFIRISSTAYNANYTKPSGTWLNDWHHILATFDRTLSTNRLKLYIDGLLVGQSNATGGNIDSGDTPILGCWNPSVANPGARQFDGYASDFMIWNRALSPTEILALYQDGNQIFKPSIDFVALVNDVVGSGLNIPILLNQYRRRWQ